MPPIDVVTAYHEVTKHRYEKTADGPGYLDWANMPEPFRRYEGTPLLALDPVPPTDEPRYEPAFVEGRIAPSALDRRSVSQLLYDSLAMSAWKQAGAATWGLRINPSSGNLHPTEGYLVCGPVAGLCDWPIVAHYAPREHALEVRARLPSDLWRRLALEFPEGTLFLGLASILWREAWKYGERAYRYCQLDVGHALGAVSVAAAALGWQVRLLDGWSGDQLAALLGVSSRGEAEREQADCLLALMPEGGTLERTAPGDLDAWMQSVEWLGAANVLSDEFVHWPHLAAVARACHKPPTSGRYRGDWPVLERLPVGDAPFGVRPIVHRRRSAVDMDGRSALTAGAFYQILRKCLPGPGQVPFTALPWQPQVHPVLFVHRVEGLAPGIYCLLRHPGAEKELRGAMQEAFVWERPEGATETLPLFRLVEGDTRAVSKQLSCHQSIASHGCFAVAMLARFDPALRENGAWFYPRLYWEAGLVGQQLYLEAYASGVSATGIGCFFDDPVHELLGLEGREWQDLYHFTVGGAVEDPRLTTLPAYPAPI